MMKSRCRTDVPPGFLLQAGGEKYIYIFIWRRGGGWIGGKCETRAVISAHAIRQIIQFSLQQ